jgi:Protein kinase domain
MLCGAHSRLRGWQAVVTAQTSGQRQGMKLAERYQLAERLGEGSVCVIYRGQDLTLRRPVVVKVVPPAYAQAYHDALRLASSFAHSSVVCLYDAIEQDESLYLVQEYVAARSLDHYLASGLPIERAVDVARQIALAVSYAHAREVAHGDLTPAAVLIDRHAVVRLNNFCVPADRAYFARMRATIAQTVSQDQADAGPLKAEAEDVAALGYLLWLMTTEPAPGEEQRLERVVRADTPDSLTTLMGRVFGQPDVAPVTNMAEFASALEDLASEYVAARAVEPLDTPAAIKAFRAMTESAAWSTEPTVASGRSLLEQVARAGPGPRRGGTEVLPPESGDTQDALADAPFGAAPRLRLPSRPIGDAASLRSTPASYQDPEEERAVAKGESESGVPLTPLLLLGGVLFLLFFLVGFYSFTLGR